MTHADKWKKRDCVLRYRAFCDELRLKAPRERPHELNLVFGIPMPPSWSEKKKLAMDGKPHQQTPDIDNLTKGYFDALYEQDCVIWKITAQKVWARDGFISTGQQDY